MRTTTRFASTLGVAALAVIGLSACASGGGGAGTEADGSEAAGSAATSSSSSPMAQSGSAAPSSSMSPGTGSAGSMDPAAMLVGPGCDDYAEQVPDGAGSVEGMAQDPVATAASNNPMLTTLTKAVSGGLNPDVDLVDTLNGGEFTVFAPVDDAFAAIPEQDLEAVVSDADTLSSVLTYHVVPGRISPDEIAGEQTTVQGAAVEVTGEGDELMVNDASVICGGVQTANATVYLIDSVLMPPKGQ